LLIEHEDPLALKVIRVLLLHDPGVPRPRGTILGPDVQIALERVGGLAHVLAGLGAAGTVQKGPRVPPDLDPVYQVQTAGAHRDDREQDRHENQVEPSHHPDLSPIQLEGEGVPRFRCGSVERLRRDLHRAG